MSVKKMSLVIVILVFLSAFSSPVYEEASPDPETLTEPERPEMATQAEQELLQNIGRILYASAEYGPYDIFAMDPDGGNLTRLTEATGMWDGSSYPAWSPDGKKIAFNGGPNVTGQIWAMDADGSNPIQLTYDTEISYNPDWSLNGRIAFESWKSGRSEIWAMDADGTNQTQLTFPPYNKYHPALSPDGSKIVFEVDYDEVYLAVLDLDSGNLTQLTSSGPSRYPSWSPDGSKIAYSSWDTDTLMDLWVMNADGSRKTQLTSLPEYEEFPDWSPDGEWIVFDYGTPSNQPLRMDIWLVDAEGGTPIELLSHFHIQQTPDWWYQPDANDATPPPAPVLRKAVLAGEDYDDVEIAWNKTEDEWRAGGTVKYEIWRSTGYSGTYALLGQMMANGSSCYSYIDAGAGEGDSNNYFYKVHSVDASGNKNESRDTAGKVTRELQAGPNLVSISLVQWDERPETVFQTVEWNKAWIYDSTNQKWKWYMTFKPHLGELDRVTLAHGVWINVAQRSNLTVAGIVPLATSLTLHKGWNLVGFPSFQVGFSVADLKAMVVVEKIEGFDGLAPPYFLGIMADRDLFHAGFGYWIKAESPAIWTVENT